MSTVELCNKLRQTLIEIRAMTDADDAASYRADDPEVFGYRIFESGRSNRVGRNQTRNALRMTPAANIVL